MRINMRRGYKTFTKIKSDHYAISLRERPKEELALQQSKMTLFVHEALIPGQSGADEAMGPPTIHLGPLFGVRYILQAKHKER